MVKTISLDLDNTVFDLEPVYKLGFVDYPQYKYKSPTSWAVYECYPKEVADKILGYFRTIENYQTPLLDKRYPKLIQNWQHKHYIKIITSRRSNEPDVYFFGDIYRKKVSWVKLKTYEQIQKTGLYVPMDDIIQTTTHSKIDAIKEKKVDLVIDDSPIVVEECLENGIDCVMISTKKTPYNHYLREKTQWAKNLFEVAKMKQL